MQEIKIPSLKEIDDAAARFLEAVRGHSIIALRAPMGAGKTTFTAAICRVLGVRDDAVNSPTFSIVNEYVTASGETLYHFDFYRVEKMAEALDIGFYDYIDSGCMCIIEWPENIEEILPEETLDVTISVEDDGSRTVRF